MRDDPAAALKLVASSGRAVTRQALIFHILNRTPEAVVYDRASLWRNGRKPAFLGVSGATAPDARGPFADAWRKTIATARLGDEPSRLQDAGTPGAGGLWLPLPGTGVGLVIERWDAGFSDAEIAALADIASVYAMAWHSGRKKYPGYPALRYVKAAVATAAVAVIMILVRVPLRVTAYCEVIPDSPFLIATPVDGVIREVLVEPGQEVRAGDVLAVYEESVPAGDLELAKRQFQAAEAELTALHTRSLENPQLRSEAAILEARLEQERTRLAAVEERWSKVRIVAPMDGMIRMDEPSLWRGRPVTVGERLLWLIQPGNNHPRIWLPQSDRVDFDLSRSIHIHLDAYGERLLSAKLTRVGTLARQSPERGFAFPAEAEWLDVPDASPYLGLSGIGVLYGPEVPLGYWLARKPAASLRKWLGL